MTAESFDDAIRTGDDLRRRAIARLDHSSLTALALSANDARIAESAAAAAAADQAHAALKDEFARGLIERFAEEMTRRFAGAMGLPSDSPLLRELKWRVNPEDLVDVDFHRREEDAFVEARPRVDQPGRFDLYADIDALTIRAHLIGLGDDRLKSIAITAVFRNSTLGLPDLAALGAAIVQARKDLEANSGDN